MVEVGDGYLFLAVAVVRQALDDCEAGDVEARSWLESAGAELLLDGLDVHPAEVRRVLAGGNWRIRRGAKRANKPILAANSASGEPLTFAV